MFKVMSVMNLHQILVSSLTTRVSLGERWLVNNTLHVCRPSNTLSVEVYSDELESNNSELTSHARQRHWENDG